MAVIELGLVDSDHDGTLPEPGRRPLRRSELRRILAALVAVLCVLTVTGSARPDPGGLNQLWSIAYGPDTDAYQLGGDTVYLLTRPGSLRLTAHDVRTGAVRWSTAAVEDASWVSTVAAGVLLMPAGLATVSHKDTDGNSYSREVGRDTVAIDAATGRQLWRQRGEFTLALGDRALLSELDDAGERAQRLRMVRLRDGATIWSRAGGDRDDLGFWTTDTTLGARPDRLAIVTGQGRTEVISLADGALVTTGRLPWHTTSRSNDHSAVTVQGRLLYLDQTVGSRSTVTAYDTDTLRQLWTVEQTSSGGSYGCGPVLCISDADSTSGHDRATGKRLWQLPGSSNIFPLTDDRLLIDEENGVRRALLDAATGRRIADLGAGMPVWDSLSRASPYLVAGTQQPPGRTAVSRFDPATGEVTLLGAIAPTLDFGCQIEADLLICPTREDQLVVTDVG